MLAALPKSAHPGAGAALAEILNAEARTMRRQAAKAFEAAYGAKWPKATAKIIQHFDVLQAFHDYPAEHWIHLRTTSPISTLATLRLRQRVTKGPGSRAAGVAMAFNLIESAQARWRAVNAPHLVALVRAGAPSEPEKGKLVERPDEPAEEIGGDQQAAWHADPQLLTIARERAGRKRKGYAMSVADSAVLKPSLGRCRRTGAASDQAPFSSVLRAGLETESLARSRCRVRPSCDTRGRSRRSDPWSCRPSSDPVPRPR